jgi:hypothetical protein
MMTNPLLKILLGLSLIVAAELSIPSSALAQRGGGGHGYGHGHGGHLAPSTIVPPPGTTVFWHGRGTSGWVSGGYRGHYGGYYGYPAYDYGYGYPAYGYGYPAYGNGFGYPQFPALEPDYSNPGGYFTGPTNFDFLFP